MTSEIDPSEVKVRTGFDTTKYEHVCNTCGAREIHDSIEDCLSSLVRRVAALEPSSVPPSGEEGRKP